MTNIDESIRDFARFLDLAWPIAVGLAARSTEETFTQDWQQASWERLIEASRSLFGFRLAGSGAIALPGRPASMVETDTVGTLRTGFCPVKPLFLPPEGVSFRDCEIGRAHV